MFLGRKGKKGTKKTRGDRKGGGESLPNLRRDSEKLAGDGMSGYRKKGQGVKKMEIFIQKQIDR